MLTHYRVKRSTQMLQIVTLCTDYQYQIAYLFIINLTRDCHVMLNGIKLNGGIKCFMPKIPNNNIAG